MVFKVGPRTTTWLNGKAAKLQDYQVGDRVGVYYRLAPRTPNLDQPVEAVHIRVSRLPAGSAASAPNGRTNPGRI